MNDFISREAVWEMLEKAHIISNGEYSGYCAEDIFIDDIPSADVQPVKRGVWKECENGINKYCSYCNKVHGTIYNAENFCPNCGALMREEE